MACLPGAGGLLPPSPDGGRASADYGRRRGTTGHPGHVVSLRIRKWIEEIFGWTKGPGGLRKARHKGTDRVDRVFTLTAAAAQGRWFNPFRMRRARAG